jgi:MYXO-CTERM domain-containing protein
MPIQKNPFRQPLLISALALTATAALQAGNADAILVYEFSQQGADVRLDVSGSLTGLPSPDGPFNFCGSTFGLVGSSDAILETGCVTNNIYYPVDGPSGFGTNKEIIGFTNYTGTNLLFIGAVGGFGLPDSYVGGDPISGVGLLAGQTLASLGLSSTTPGAVLGTWIIGSDSIEVRIGGGGDAVPGPLPLLGAAAAFAHSRRLRTRIRAGATAQA